MDWIGTVIETGGYAGVALLMLLETVFPPIPSEIIMPLAGLHAVDNGHSLLLVIVAGTIGAMLGNIFWFWLAWKLGTSRFEEFLLRHGRLFTMDKREIARGRWLFERFGGGIVGVGRTIPTVRSLVSIPAGLVRMDVRSFLIFSTIGTFVWTAGLTLAGYFLGSRFTAIDKLLGPVSTGVLILCLAIYAWRVIRWPRWQH